MNIFFNRISWYDVQEKKHGRTFNTKNHFLYAPYKSCGQEMKIDKTWWESLLPSTREKIALRQFSLSTIEIPHKTTEDSEYCRKMRCALTADADYIYHRYLDSFDYHVWFDENLTNGPKNVLLFSLSDMEKTLILKNDFKLLSERLEREILSFPLFIRLSGTSGKNSFELAPIQSIQDIFTFLRLNKNVRFELQKPKETCLILMPWRKEIEPKYEFRIFVHERRLTAVSQQDWFELFEYDDDDLCLFKEAFDSIEFISQLPYNSFVADVWVDRKMQCVNLIECNPFGAHSASGSALFNWDKDFDQLHGKTNFVEFRFTSLLKNESDI